MTASRPRIRSSGTTALFITLLLFLLLYNFQRCAAQADSFLSADDNDYDYDYDSDYDSGDDTLGETAAMESLLAWLRRQGGFLSPKLEPHYFRGQGWGIRVKQSRRLPGGSVIVSVPLRTAALTRKTMEDFARRGGPVGRALAALLDVEAPGQELVSLAFLLIAMDHSDHDHDHHHGPYLTLLPDSTHIPLMWPAPDLAELQASGAVDALTAFRARLWRAYDMLVLQAAADHEPGRGAW